MEVRLTDLPGRWRADAAVLRRRQDTRAADLLEGAAAELEDAIAGGGMEKLTPRQAATESGYTAAHIRRMIQSGTVTNAGTPERPMILRRDLPRKPGHGVVSKPALSVSSKSQAARIVIAGD